MTRSTREKELLQDIIQDPNPNGPQYEAKVIQLASLRSARPDPAEDKMGIHHIKMKGDLLGKGSYGEAYRLGDKVYKIHHPDIDENAAKRSAGYWNQLYLRIYDGKYSRYATATHQKIDDKDILITPYIKGLPFFDTSCCLPNRALKRFTQALKKIGLGMSDKDIEGNLVIVDENILPVDFDQIYRAPENYHCFFYRYSSFNPPSPTSFNLAKRDHYSYFVKIRDESNKKKEAGDAIGFRSMFMRA